MRFGLKVRNAATFDPRIQTVILAGLVLLLSAPLGGCTTVPKEVDGHRRLRKKSQLKERVNQKVFIEGRVSRTPWQHMIPSPLPHPVTNYVDWEGGQLVVYAKKKLPRQGRLRVFGTIVRFRGRSKGGDSWTVYHLKASHWKPL